MKLPRLSLAVAAGSGLSLMAQALFSLAMLKLFAPAAVGTFSVVSQVAFFWMTLALAQSPLTLLANAHAPASTALRRALWGSAGRWLLLAPATGAVLWWSALPSLGQALAWAAGLAWLQGGWYLAQAHALKTRTPTSAALVKAVPPLTALAAASAAALWGMGDQAASLVVAALVGYGTGALWLIPACPPPSAASAPSAPPATQRDDRSPALRLAHTAMDALTGAALLVLWQRQHGSAAAGYFAVLLRLLGFVPALVHTSWAQVLLARGAAPGTAPLRVGSLGALATMAIAIACTLLLPWLAPAWQGAAAYVLPVALWQAAACLHAACSHLPFQNGQARAFSQTAIALTLLQWGVLCLPLLAPWRQMASTTHVWWLSLVSATGLVLWAWRMNHRARVGTKT